PGCRACLSMRTSTRKASRRSGWLSQRSAGAEELPAQEFLLVRADGSTVPAAAAVSASYGPGGRVTEFQWVFRDISREKQFEEASGRARSGPGRSWRARPS
ncbi:PAS domain S-box protein, partial [Methanoculleus chikugoensis]|uniref:PAS domain S-box protein n=1 Tax=Methanoculleus chikugoensis TaxID=118126 RepID=UPI001FB45295